jgi:S1-C subfamily serine protease
MKRADILQHRHERLAQEPTPVMNMGEMARQTRGRGCFWAIGGGAAVLVLLGMWAFCSVSNRADAMAGSGTGFFISPDGWLVTAAHVVEDASMVMVRSGTDQWPAEVMNLDGVHDVALLRVATTRAVPFLPLGDSATVRMGYDVFTVGFPNIGIQGVSPKLTRGEISSVTGLLDDPRFFQISVPVQPGNSGGPLIDMQGRVLGVVVSRLDDRFALFASGALPQNVNYAIKSSHVRDLIAGFSGSGLSLPSPSRPAARFDEAVEKAEAAVALVLVDYRSGGHDTP